MGQFASKEANQATDDVHYTFNIVLSTIDMVINVCQPLGVVCRVQALSWGKMTPVKVSQYNNNRVEATQTRWLN